MPHYPQAIEASEGLGLPLVYCLGVIYGFESKSGHADHRGKSALWASGFRFGNRMRVIRAANLNKRKPR